MTMTNAIDADKTVPLPSLLQEYQGVDHENILSIEEIMSTSRQLRKSLIDNLNQDYSLFRSNCKNLHKIRSEFACLESQIKTLNKEARNNVMPYLTSVSLSDSDVDLSVTSSTNLSPSKLTGIVVEQLQEVLELQDCCTYLLTVHNSVEQFRACTEELLCRAGYTNDNAVWFSDDGIEEKDSFDENEDDDKSSLKNNADLSDLLSQVADSLHQTEQLIAAQKNSFDKEAVIVFRDIWRRFLDLKSNLGDFLKQQWTELIRISKPTTSTSTSTSKKDECILASLEVHGDVSFRIEPILDLMGALDETPILVTKLYKEIWNTFFVPWFDSRSGLDNNHFELRTNDQHVECTQSFEWRLDLVKPRSNQLTTDCSPKSAVFACRQLSTVLQSLYTHLFGLQIAKSPSQWVEGRKEVGSLRTRIVDLGRSLGLFDGELAKRLINGPLLRSIPATALDNCKIEFIEPVTEAVVSLIETATRCGFMAEDSDVSSSHSSVSASQRLAGFLSHLEELANQHLGHAYFKAVKEILVKSENFALTEKVGFCKENVLPQEVPTIKRTSFMTEEELQQAELTKLFHNINLEFPSCSVSKAVLELMSTVNMMIDVATSVVEATTSKGQEGDNADLQARVLSIISNVPRLILLYLHLVPTFHCDRMRTDTAFLCTYYNDSMYLAHECLTLGRARLFPLAQLVSEEVSGKNALSQLAAISTTSLVVQLRQAATSALLKHLADEYQAKLQHYFKMADGLQNSADTNAEACERATLTCISLLLKASTDLNRLPFTIYLRALGVLADELVKLMSTSILRLSDVTTRECAALTQLIRSVTGSITSIFKKHVDAAFDASLGSSWKPEDKSVTFLLNRRVPSWTRLIGILSVLEASSLQEIHTLWKSRSQLKTSPSTAQLRPAELRSLIKALYRESDARANLLKLIQD